MTDIEQRARDALNVPMSRCDWRDLDDTHTRKSNRHVEAMCRHVEAMCRQIEAHDATKAEFEAFKREVSDMLLLMGFQRGDVRIVGRFILPESVDPLVEEAAKMFEQWVNSTEPGWEMVERAIKHGMELANAAGCAKE